MTKLNDKLQNTPVSTTAPTDGQILIYVGADGKWEPQTSSPGSGPVIQDGGTVGANIRLDTSLASPIDDTQSGIVNIGSFTNEGTSYTIINANVILGYPSDILITTSEILNILPSETIVISGVTGTTEANGTWISTPLFSGIRATLNNGSGVIQIQTNIPVLQLSGNSVVLSAVGVNVFGVTNNSGLIQISTASNNLVTGDTVTISGVLGTTEANGTWIITVIGIGAFTLNGSTFTNAYISGGIFNLGTDVINGTWIVTPVITSVSNVSNNSGTIQITLSSVTTINDNDSVVISGVTGTTEANGTWSISGSDEFGDGLNFNLLGSTFTNAYTGGGSANFTTEFTLDSSSGGFAISNVNSATPIQITTTNPNTFVTGDIVNIAGVEGVSINASSYAITVIDNQNFTLTGEIGSAGYVSDTGYASYTYAILSSQGAAYSAFGEFLGENNLLIPATFVNPYVSGGTITLRSGVFGSYSDILGGDQNYIDGYYSMIGGGNQNSTESGYTVIAGGFQNTIVEGADYSVIIGGFGNTINANGFNPYGNLNGNEGYNNSSGANVINGGVGNIIGIETTDNSNFCLVEGILNTVSSSSAYSHTEGFANAMYSGNNSHIEGGFNDSSNDDACHIEGGNNNTTSNTYVHVEGNGNTSVSSNTGTHVEGNANSAASDFYSHIEGFSGSLSSTQYCHVEGSSCEVSEAIAAHAQGVASWAVRNAQDAMASGAFAVQGDAQVSNIVLRGQGNGTFQLGYNITTGSGSGTNFNLVAASGTFIIEAIAQDLNTGDYASFQQTHLVYCNSSSAVYVGCAPYLNTNSATGPLFNGFAGGLGSSSPGSDNGGPPVAATAGAAVPYTNWTITGSTDGTNMIFTFTNLIGSGNISVVANVRFIENNSA